MDFKAHVEEQFGWLLTMARTPGWEAYARRRAKELEATDSMYAGMWPRLAEAMVWQVGEVVDARDDQQEGRSRQAKPAASHGGQG